MDNNAISGYLSDLFSEKAMDFVAIVIDQGPIISVITAIEALSWVNPDKNKEAVIKSFVQDANVLSLSSEVVDQCVKLRRSRKLKTPDAIIAATAMVYGLTLITSDGVFSNISGLKVIDPRKY